MGRIAKVSKNKKMTPEVVPIKEFYDRVGISTFGLTPNPNKDSDECLAYQDGKTYYAKFITGGINQGHLVNPFDPFFSKENKHDSIRGVNLYTFKKVNQATFDLYTKFLSSRNELWLRRAEREVNG